MLQRLNSVQYFAPVFPLLTSLSFSSSFNYTAFLTEWHIVMAQWMIRRSAHLTQATNRAFIATISSHGKICATAQLQQTGHITLVEVAAVDTREQAGDPTLRCHPMVITRQRGQTTGTWPDPRLAWWQPLEVAHRPNPGTCKYIEFVSFLPTFLNPLLKIKCGSLPVVNHFLSIPHYEL